MSDTPRTDASCFDATCQKPDDPKDYIEVVYADHARQLERELTAAQKDAERLKWIESKLFMSDWNGVVDSGSRIIWRIQSGYRHITALMEGQSFKDAIDAAIASNITKTESQP